MSSSSAPLEPSNSPPLPLEQGQNELGQDIGQTKHAEQALQGSQAQMRSLLAAMSDVVVVVHRSGQFSHIDTYTNLHYSADQREPAETATVQSVWEVFPRATAQLFMDCTEAVLATGVPQRLEYSLEIAESTVWFDASISQLDDNQVVWVARDISEFKRTQLALERSQADLQRSEESYRLLFTNNPHPLWVYDLETLAFLEVNDAAVRKYGYSRDEFLAMTLADIRPQEDLPALIGNISQVVEGLDEAGIWRHQTKAGSLIEVEITSHTLVFNGRRAELVLAHDITARRRAEVALVHHTLHDALTQLPNRMFLTQRLQPLVNQGHRQAQLGYAVLFLDLDRFKVINDSLGHSIGDLALVAVAQKLQSLVRADDLIARWGGDEFVILLKDADPVKAAINLAQRLVSDFQTPLSLPDREVVLGTSIGIVIGSPAYGDPADVLRDADIAMYQAKAQGRNRYALFDEGMHALALQRLGLENELRQAVDQSAWVVHYQPILSLPDKRVVSLEALVRWQHPQGKLLGPDCFIPLAEEMGLITAIDLWVLREVCRQIKQWQAIPGLNVAVNVAVNLSVRDLWNPSLADDIEQVLADNDLAGTALSLEITESMLIEDLEVTTQLLQRFQQQGVRISIDDFGTGYSSLKYLHSLPVETLKIDGSFVNQMQESDRNLKIVETIITLGQHLDLKVIAEGIETEEQYTLLHQLGCDYGQGFWLSMPLPAGDTLAFLLSAAAA
jgi:diguanylate cyclase (GGDEF)-like protein/PAS domain S-box-containing protein